MSILKSFYIPIILLPLIVLTIDCSLNTSTSPQEAPIIPGLIHLSLIENPASTKSDYEMIPQQEKCVDFYLGDLKASRDFYFLIRNIGNVPIWGITIKSSNPQFCVSPDSISILEPYEISPILTILSLGAIHGVALEGVGFTDVMEMDTNSSTITIRGKTITQDRIDTIVTFSASVSVNALLLDIAIYDGDSLRDLTKYDYYATSILGGLGHMKGIDCEDTVRIINTGNVPITITIPEDFPSFNYTFNPGDTFVVDLPDTIKNGQFRFDGDNTITDYRYLHIGDDGAAYYSLTF